VIWRFEKNKTGKLTKVPYQAQRPDVKASSKDPTTWSDYQTAVEAAIAAQADGIGFILTGTEIAAFDLDDCRKKETGEIAAWALKLVERAGSYTEVTVSGTGLRIIGTGTGPEVHRKLNAEDGGSLECYRKATRYIAMTGEIFKDLPMANIDTVMNEVVVELDGKKKPNGGAYHARLDDDSVDDLDDLVKNGRYERFDGDRSRAVFSGITSHLIRGYYEPAIVAKFTDPANRISEHINEKPNPIQYAWRQVREAIKKIDFARDKDGKAVPTQGNIRIALLKMGVRVRYDMFADRIMIEGLPCFGPVLQDEALDRMWLVTEQRFKFRPSQSLFRTVVQDTAQLNGFHPVRDYLKGLKWDGVKRIDKWLTTYGGAEESEYTCAVGALFLTAGVRRVKQPGCKFDEMMVLECPIQGTEKSNALGALAVRPEWFTDDLPLNADSKRVIETLAGRWIVEASELQGMRRADIEHLKSFLSRQVDSARMAYGHIRKEMPRQCVIGGTTNNQEYLHDKTGNRRYWPVRVEKFDIEHLRRDVDQLWAEAAAREATGVSIRLDPTLWPEAAKEQALRTAEDPYYEILLESLGDLAGKIRSEDLWGVLDVPRERRGPAQSGRLTEAMNKLGWSRTKSRLVKIDNKNVVGFIKGEQPWKVIRRYLNEFRADEKADDEDGVVF
jgi:hypothetical protein